jgi:hypothetical protein
VTIKFSFMNGWKEAPHMWKYHLFLNAFNWERNPAWTSISIFGFVIFFYVTAKH